MIIKNKDKLIPWREVRNELFTKEEQKILDARFRLRMVLREIREKRKKESYTQQFIAEKANLPRTTISKIESGYQNVSILKLMQVAEAMDMQIEIKLVPMRK